MFSAIHQNPIRLLKLFKSIDDIVPEITIKISNEGFSIRSMDESHTCFLDIFISKNEFDEYNFNCKDDKIDISVVTSNLCKMLSIAEEKDNLTFKLKNKNSDCLSLLFDNDSRKTRFKIRLIDVADSEQELIDMRYTVNMDIDINRFIKTCNNLDVIGSNDITFSIQTDKIFIIGNGDIGDVKSELKINNNVLVKKRKKKLKLKKNGKTIIIKPKESLEKEYVLNDFRQKFNISFSIKHILKILKLSSLTNRVMVNLNEESPIKLNFTFENNSYLDFYMAPKCE